MYDFPDSGHYAPRRVPLAKSLAPPPAAPKPAVASLGVWGGLGGIALGLALIAISAVGGVIPPEMAAEMAVIGAGQIAAGGAALLGRLRARRLIDRIL